MQSYARPHMLRTKETRLILCMWIMVILSQARIGAQQMLIDELEGKLPQQTGGSGGRR